MAFPVAANPDMPTPRRSPAVGQSPYPDAELNDPGFTGVFSASGVVPCVIEAPANRAVRVQLFEPSMHQEQPEQVLEEFFLDAGERVVREVPSPNTSYRFLDRRVEDTDFEEAALTPQLPEVEAEAAAGSERLAVFEAAEDERQEVEEENRQRREQEQKKRQDARNKDMQAQAKEREARDKEQEKARADRAKDRDQRAKQQHQDSHSKK